MMHATLRRATAALALAAMSTVQGCYGYRRPPVGKFAPDDRVVIESTRSAFPVHLLAADGESVAGACRADRLEGRLETIAADTVVLRVSRAESGGGSRPSCPAEGRARVMLGEDPASAPIISRKGDAGAATVGVFIGLGLAALIVLVYDWARGERIEVENLPGPVP